MHIGTWAGALECLCCVSTQTSLPSRPNPPGKQQPFCSSALPGELLPSYPLFAFIGLLWIYKMHFSCIEMIMVTWYVVSMYIKISRPAYCLFKAKYAN